MTIAPFTQDHHRKWIQIQTQDHIVQVDLVIRIAILHGAESRTGSRKVSHVNGASDMTSVGANRGEQMKLLKRMGKYWGDGQV